MTFINLLIQCYKHFHLEQIFISRFSADITRTLTAKRKRLHTFTQASLKSSNKKYEDIFKAQHSERSAKFFILSIL